MNWVKFPDEKPKKNEVVWVYIPFFNDKWKHSTPDVIKLQFDGENFKGIGENTKYVLGWHKVIESYNEMPPDHKISIFRVNNDTHKDQS